MKQRLLGAVMASVLGIMLAGSAGAAQPPIIVTPDKIHWVPGTGPLKGTQVAVLDGDPMKAGEYTMRVNIPDGLRLPVHYHGHAERVTVISGTLLVALGDKVVDPSKMVALSAGSYADVPPGVHHYAMARGTTVIQISSEGPRSMTVTEHMHMSP